MVNRKIEFELSSDGKMTLNGKRVVISGEPPIDETVSERNKRIRNQTANAIDDVNNPVDRKSVSTSGAKLRRSPQKGDRFELDPATERIMAVDVLRSGSFIKPDSTQLMGFVVPTPKGTEIAEHADYMIDLMSLLGSYDNNCVRTGGCVVIDGVGFTQPAISGYVREGDYRIGSRQNLVTAPDLREGGRTSANLVKLG